MHKLCNQINIAQKKNYIFLDIKYKKKYIYILNVLLKMNLIKNFSFNKNFIRINLRYFKNRSIFYLTCKQTSSKNDYFKLNNIEKDIKNKNDFIDIYSCSLFGYNEKNILFLKGTGGLLVLKINLINL
jgi:hypothetical protein